MRLKSALVFAASIAVPLAIASNFTSFSNALPSSTPQSGILMTRDPGAWINVRTGPSTQAAIAYTSYPGSSVEVLGQTRSPDGYTWYHVRLLQGSREGWVRGDLISLSSVAPSPNLTPTSAPPRTTPPTPVPGWVDSVTGSTSSPAPQSRNTPAPAPNSRPAATYTQEQIDYFLEIAMGAEWGNSGSTVRKWRDNPRIHVSGSPTREDMATLNAVVNELNTLTGGSIQLQFDDRNPNVEIYFVPVADFARYEPNYVPGNLGFFWTRWSGNFISSARILITTGGVTQRERSHLIREELTQSLGLMRDSNRYRDSIFYQGWTDVTAYSAIDRAIISMLYRPEIQSGMTRSQVVSTLRNLANPRQAFRWWNPFAQ